MEDLLPRDVSTFFPDIPFNIEKEKLKLKISLDELYSSKLSPSLITFFDKLREYDKRHNNLL